MRKDMGQGKSRSPSGPSTPSMQTSPSGQSPGRVQAPGRDGDETTMPDRSAIRGEGDPQSARNYNESQQDFVQSGGVQQAAQQAAPRDQAESESMQEAEAKARERAKGEDPTVPGANALHGKKSP